MFVAKANQHSSLFLGVPLHEAIIFLSRALGVPLASRLGFKRLLLIILRSGLCNDPPREDHDQRSEKSGN